MGMLDDGLNEYEELQQDSTPTVPVQQSQSQPKSAEQAEIEKSLEVLKGINEIQSNMRSTMSEIKDMAGKADELTRHLEQEVKAVKPLWDQLLEGFTKDIIISKESMEAYNKLMLDHTNKILSNAYERIDKSITDNFAGQFNEVANKHIADFDTKAEQAVIKYKKAYEENIKTLEDTQDKLLKQAIEENNRIVIPTLPFWTIVCILGFIILCGFICWLKFWRMPGNDETLTYMGVTGVFEFIFFAVLGWSRYTDEDRKKSKKEKKDEPTIYSISLSQAIYGILLTMSAGTYIVWSQMTVTSDTWLLKWLLPVAVASNLIWFTLKGLAAGIFRNS